MGFEDTSTMDEIKRKREAYQPMFHAMRDTALNHLVSGKAKNAILPGALAVVLSGLNSRRHKNTDKAYKQATGDIISKERESRQADLAEKASRIQNREDKYNLQMKRQESRDADRERQYKERTAFQNASLRLKERALNQRSENERQRNIQKSNSLRDRIMLQNQARQDKERARKEKLNQDIYKGYANKISDPQQREEFWRNPEANRSRLVEKKRAWFNPMNLKSGSRHAGYELSPVQKAVQRTSFKDTDEDKIAYLKKRGYVV
jgi:hypothetical protein